MKRIIIAMAVAACLFGCQNAEKKYGSVASTEEISSGESADSTSTVAPKIIKTADMRFRVKDVQNTKEKLSQTIKAQGGTVAEFSIQSLSRKARRLNNRSIRLKKLLHTVPKVIW